MGRIAYGLVVTSGVLVTALFVGAAWVCSTGHARLSQTFHPHAAPLAIPAPLTDKDLKALTARRYASFAAEHPGDSLDFFQPLEGVDLDAVARANAITRGEHLVKARYACGECHGADFGGGVMVDDAMFGQFFGPNLTQGRGSVVLDYTPSDWDFIVRHGVKPDGHPTIMPSGDFVRMSDQELADIVTYIQSLPPVDATRASPVQFGPIGHVLLAVGGIHLSAESINHHAPHAPVPPPAEPSTAFGEHLANVCTGCHGADLAGGPIAGGDPSWPPATDIRAKALSAWSYDQFVAAMREGVRPNGTALQPPMSAMLPVAQQMTDTEMQALWAYLQTVGASN